MTSESQIVSELQGQVVPTSGTLRDEVVLTLVALVLGVMFVALLAEDYVR